MTSHRDVAHAWITQSKPRLSGYNMWFEGDTIYSYGTHFAIARLDVVKGNRICLLTTRTHSVSTTQHTNLTCRTAQDFGREIVRVYDPKGVQDHAVNYNALMALATEFLRRARRARVYAGSYVASFHSVMREAARYAELFDLDTSDLDTADGRELLRLVSNDEYRVAA